MERLVCVVSAVMVGSCAVTLGLEPDTEIRCTDADQCPEDLVCLTDFQRCVSPTAACVEQSGETYGARPYGDPCTLDDGEAGICFEGACAEVVCGDGLISGDEECEEAPDSRAFADPNDGCDACREVSWQAEVLFGLYGGGASLDEVPVGELVGLTINDAGDIFFADPTRHRVWRVDGETRTIAVAAGTGVPGEAGDGGPAAAAQLNFPNDVAVDRLGNLYIADTFNNRIRKVSPNGDIETFAGTGAYITCTPPCGDGGLAAEADVSLPVGVAVDASGVLYFTEIGIASVVRYVTPTGDEIGTLAGDWDERGCTDGPAATARFQEPRGITVGADGTVYVADSLNSRVVAIDDGQVTTVAGSTESTLVPTYCDWGFNGESGPATTTLLDTPTDVIVDADDTLYVIDAYNQRLRRVSSAGTMETVAWDVGGVPVDEEIPYDSPLYPKYAAGLTVDRDGVLYVSSSVLRRIDRVVPGTSFTVEPFAGNGATAIYVDPVPTLATDLVPYGLAFTGDGRLLIADVASERIRRLESNGTLTTFAGNGERLFSGDGGPAVEAGLIPWAMVDDGAGTVFVADLLNSRVRRIDPSGIITTYAGDGTYPVGEPAEGVPAIATQLFATYDLAWVGAELYIASERRIRKVRADGIIERVCGTGEDANTGDGGPAIDAAIGRIRTLGVDADGWLCISTNFHQIRCIDVASPTPNIYTVAGTGEFDAPPMDTEMPSISAQLRSPGQVIPPSGAAWEGSNPLMIFAESGWNALRAIDTSGQIHLLVGGVGGLSGDGGSVADARLANPLVLARDTAGNLFVGEDRRVRKIDPAGTITTVAGAIHPGDGDFAEASLVNPWALARLLDAETFLVADGIHGQIRRVSLGDETVSSVAGYPGGIPDSGGEDLAAGTRLFADAAGLAIDETVDPAVVYVAERAGGVIRRIRLVEPEDPSTWTVRVFAGASGALDHVDGALAVSRLAGPSELALDADARRLYVVDTQSHTLRVIDLNAATIDTVAGTPFFPGYFGDGLPAEEALFDLPVGVVLGTQGDLYVSEAGNHRVRRIDGDGTVSTVLGIGLPSSNGEGSPAAQLPVNLPIGMALDDYGNLFVASSETVRLVIAGEDGLATGEDEVRTLYGATPRVSFPESVTECLSGLRITSGGDRLYALDYCQGYFLQLTRGP